MPVKGESKQWHEWPAIVKSNLKSILVFVEHPPGGLIKWFTASQTDRLNEFT